MNALTLMTIGLTICGVPFGLFLCIGAPVLIINYGDGFAKLLAIVPFGFGVGILGMVWGAWEMDAWDRKRDRRS